jgi:uncharacterized short protein YbdD (DUF466 family)
MRAAVPGELRRAAARLHYWIREFLGENDYARYVAEWHAAHRSIEDCATRATSPARAAESSAGAARASAGHRLMTEREFFAERLRVKYGGAVQRCC